MTYSSPYSPSRCRSVANAVPWLTHQAAATRAVVQGELRAARRDRAIHRGPDVVRHGSFGVPRSRLSSRARSEASRALRPTTSASAAAIFAASPSVSGVAGRSGEAPGGAASRSVERSPARSAGKTRNSSAGSMAKPPSSVWVAEDRLRSPSRPRIGACAAKVHDDPMGWRAPRVGLLDPDCQATIDSLFFR